MELLLKRFYKDGKTTLGALFHKETPQLICFTLEDDIKEVKIKGETAIPTGRYQVIINMSARFKVMMPLLLHVPGFEGIRIHKGNTAADTSGCILVGMSTNDQKTALVNSKAAFNKVFGILNEAINKGEQVFITIVNDFPTSKRQTESAAFQPKAARPSSQSETPVAPVSRQAQRAPTDAANEAAQFIPLPVAPPARIEREPAPADVTIKQVEPVESQPVIVKALLEKIKGVVAASGGITALLALFKWDDFAALPLPMQVALIASAVLVLCVAGCLYAQYVAQGRKQTHYLTVMRETQAYNLTLASLKAASDPQSNNVNVERKKSYER